MAGSEAACQLRSRFTMQPKEFNDGKTSKGTQRAQLTRLILKLEREEENRISPETSLDQDPLTAISAEHHQEPTFRRAIIYGMLSLSLMLSIFALMWTRRDFKPAEVPKWEPVFALAEVAREKGELYDARGLYSQTGRFATRSGDWVGLLAAACGFDKLEKKSNPYSARDSLILRAMAAAEQKQSRAGLTAVAKAFTFLGKHESAAMALSRIRKNWATEDNHSANVVLSDCWTNMPNHRIDLTGE